MEKISNLADCIPPELVEEIYKNGKEHNDQHVYRVAKYGIINEIAFLGTYEECIYEKRENRYNINEIGTYSTSCYITPKMPQKFLCNLKRKHFKKFPHPIIIHGNTICGLSQLTIERDSSSNEEHIDWWIYKDSFQKLQETFEVYD